MKLNSKSSIQMCLLMLSFLIAEGMYGQTKKTTLEKIYLEIGTGPTTQDGILSEFAVRSVLKHNWTASFSYHKIEEMNLSPKNLPDGYIPGHGTFLYIPFSDGYPTTPNMNIYSFTAGRCLKVGRTTWFTTEAGLSMVSGEKSNFSPQPITETAGLLGTYYSANYSYTRESKTTVGGMIQADFNWALRYVGLSVGGFVDANSIQPVTGLEFKLIVGWLNTKRKSTK